MFSCAASMKNNMIYKVFLSKKPKERSPVVKQPLALLSMPIGTWGPYLARQLVEETPRYMAIYRTLTFWQIVDYERKLALSRCGVLIWSLLSLSRRFAIGGLGNRENTYGMNTKTNYRRCWDKFPEDDLRGIDYVADYSYIVDNIDRVKAVW